MREPDIAAELIQMAERDETVRNELLRRGELHGGYHPKMRTVHTENGDRLAEILDQLDGWPDHRLVGPDGCSAAWLIAQHAIADPVLMRRSQSLMAKAAAAGDAEAKQVAHLVDRICAFEERDQVYGTHLDWDDQGRFNIWPPVEDVSSVEERRAAVGLYPYAERLEEVAERRREFGREMSKAEVAEWRAQEHAFAVEVGWVES